MEQLLNILSASQTNYLLNILENSNISIIILWYVLVGLSTVLLTASCFYFCLFENFFPFLTKNTHILLNALVGYFSSLFVSFKIMLPIVIKISAINTTEKVNQIQEYNFLSYENNQKTFSEYFCIYPNKNYADIEWQSLTNFAYDAFYWSTETFLILISVGIAGYLIYKGSNFVYIKNTNNYTTINEIFQQIDELDRKAKILKQQLENMNFPPLTQYYADGNYVDLQIVISQILEQQHLHEQLMRDILAIFSW